MLLNVTHYYSVLRHHSISLYICPLTQILAKDTNPQLAMGAISCCRFEQISIWLVSARALDQVMQTYLVAG